MDPQAPLFTIIMPTYNRANLIEKGINSVLHQTFVSWELIIVDDGSTDETRMVVERYTDPRIRYLYQSHGERSSARNRGIEEAKGLYICFLDDDDYFLEHHLASLQNCIAENEHPVWVLRTSFYYEKEGQRSPTPFYSPHKDQHPILFFLHNICGIHTVCYHRTILEKHQFHEKLNHWQDTHLLIRCLLFYPFRQIETISCVYVIHPRMGSRSVYTQADGEQRMANNAAAIADVFEQYGPQLEAYVPPHTLDYLISQKYLEHANGALLARQFRLALRLLRKAVSYDQKAWFWKYYLKFLLKLPLKFLFNYPKFS